MTYEFVRFDGFAANGNRTSPQNMSVGQVIERKNPCKVTRYRLRSQMRNAMKLGMEFGVAEGDDFFVIRRDK